ncbi:MAG: YIEGIA family protein [Syntrophomonadaceae bacterium]|jgi:hypothetical protein|nr:YIEGIA family protein [Syntrophomonadaceae bacterium]
MENYLYAIVMGIAVGVINRVLMLRNDHRNYPTYPHGHLTHLSLGFMAAALGAVAVPAIAEADYTAATFLVLAAQQFRDIRNMERETLNRLEETKMVLRGADYIEGIARVFEARNYLVILSALVTSGLVVYLNFIYALAGAVVCVLFSLCLMNGKFIGDIAEVEKAELYFDGSLLKINDIVFNNVGLPQVRKKILDEGLGVIIKPKDDNARLTLDALGQRMAIIHDVVSILGSKVEVDEKELTPMARKDPDKGYLALYIVANEPDLEILIDVIKKVPVLESAYNTTLKTFLGRKAAD